MTKCPVCHTPIIYKHWNEQCHSNNGIRHDYYVYFSQIIGKIVYELIYIGKYRIIRDYFNDEIIRTALSFSGNTYKLGNIGNLDLYKMTEERLDEKAKLVFTFQ
jgi:hypothetical protein